MNRNRKWWLLVLSVIPTAGLIFLVIHSFLHFDEPPLDLPGWLTVFPIASGFGMYLYYIDTEGRRDRPLARRITRQILIHISAFFALPLWWYIYVWKGQQFVTREKAEMERHSRAASRKWVLAFSTIPSVIVCCFLIDMIAHGEESRRISEPPWLVASMILLVLSLFCMSLYYVNIEARSERPLGKRLCREFAILFFNFLAFPFCWYYYFWREPPASTPSNAPLTPN